MIAHLRKLVLVTSVLHVCQVTLAAHPRCGARSNRKLKYTMGDALTDSPDCVGINGEKYPIDQILELVPDLRARTGRSGRRFFSSPDSVSPLEMRGQLLHAYGAANGFQHVPSFDQVIARAKREANATDASSNSTSSSNSSASSCPTAGTTPSRLCKSSFNTTAPMFGVSLTSRKPVTIVQKFPDLLQQVIYETCDSKECDVVQGECVQTYMPYLFLVLPLGPVTLTGQDYVLVESGCTCRPRHAATPDPDPLSVIPNFQ